MYLPNLDAQARVMMFAPHPDDESLAAGVFLQRAVTSGAAVRIVYATDGERNGWPQRLLERRMRLRENDRRRWARRRRAEAIAALGVLRVGLAQVQFLSLPDQGLTNLLFDGCHETLHRLALAIGTWRPTHLLIPSAADTHPDHSALAVLLNMVCEDFLPRSLAVKRLEYLVHGASGSFAQRACDLPQSISEVEAKRRAISCHVTQVALSRRRFLRYAKRPERFALSGENSGPCVDGPIRSFQRNRSHLRLEVAFALKPLHAEETSLYLVGQDISGGRRSLRVVLPARTSKLDLIDCGTGEIAGVGRYLGDKFRAEIVLPAHPFARDKSLYLKLDRRVWFFDEAGWREIAPVPSRTAYPSPGPAAARELAVA
ncbi:MAG: PIG-L family deacetylase [Chthoniobacterales bacterium]|nr:PIG-L family deacetylase [Chthoniobacterales bacterium]